MGVSTKLAIIAALLRLLTTKSVIMSRRCTRDIGIIENESFTDLACPALRRLGAKEAVLGMA